MALSGGYLQPLERVGFIDVTAVSGYTTYRMQVQLPSGTTSTIAVPYGTMTFQFENMGTANTTVQLKQATAVDYRSGRTNLGAAQALTPGGFTKFDACPTQQIVELWCTAGGPASVRGQVVTRLNYTVLGFTQDGQVDPYYPPAFWQAELPPVT